MVSHGFSTPFGAGHDLMAEAGLAVFERLAFRGRRRVRDALLRPRHLVEAGIVAIN
jgi:hypothetical protein